MRGAAVFLVAVVGCYTQPNPSIRGRIASRACKTVEECRALLIEANAEQCGVGGPRCEEVAANVEAAKRLVASRTEQAAEDAVKVERERSREASREFDRKKGEEERAEREAAQTRQREAGNRHYVGIWLSRAAQACSQKLDLSWCDEKRHQNSTPTDEDLATCRATCETAIKGASGKAYEKSLHACIRDEAKPVCTFPALLAPSLDGAKCAKDCADIRKTEAQAEELVRQYKRCMMATDSTREARKLSAYDKDLYNDLMVKADDRCRKASRCDWVERNPDIQCLYRTD